MIGSSYEKKQTHDEPTAFIRKSYIKLSKPLYGGILIATQKSTDGSIDNGNGMLGTH
jgi:hypothetical protein